MDVKQTKNPADRAVARVRAAVTQLALLLGDEDPATADAAAMAVGAIGPFAVGPLASALPKGPSPRHRVAILAGLLTVGRQETAAVSRALKGAIERDPDPHVRAVAEACMVRLLLNDAVSRPSATRHGSRVLLEAPPPRRQPPRAGGPDRTGRPRT